MESGPNRQCVTAVQFLPCHCLPRASQGVAEDNVSDLCMTCFECRRREILYDLLWMVRNQVRISNLLLDFRANRLDDEWSLQLHAKTVLNFALLCKYFALPLKFKTIFAVWNCTISPYCSSVEHESQKFRRTQHRLRDTVTFVEIYCEYVDMMEWTPDGKTANTS